MQMNAGLILAGQSPDIMGQFGRGQQIAQQGRDNAHTNAFRTMLQQQGAGIMQGDQNALAALAGYDPQAALGVQQTRQNMEVQREQLAITRQNAARAAAQWAAQQDERTLAREQQNIERGLAMGTQAQTPEQWDALMSQYAPDFVGQFDNREMLFAGAMGIADALRARQGAGPDFGSTPQGYARIPDPQSPVGARYEQVPGMPSSAGGAPTVRNVTLSDGSEVMVQYNPQTGAWDPAQIPQGGTAGTGRRVDLTEAQARTTLFQSMQEETAPILNQIEQGWNPSNVGDAVARTIPFGGQFFQSQEGQAYQAAAAVWAEGALRLATGAAATQPEIERVVRTYFAQPGDTPETVQFKSRLRDMYTRSIRRSLGETGVSGDLELPWDFAQQQGGSTSGQPQQPSETIPAPPPGIEPDDWQTIWPALTPEERRLFQ